MFKSVSVVTNLNADLLDGCHRDEILSPDTLELFRDALMWLLQANGGYQEFEDRLELIRELRIANRSRIESATGIGGSVDTQIRPDRDPSRTQADLAAAFGGFSAADGRTITIPLSTMFS